MPRKPAGTIQWVRPKDGEPGHYQVLLTLPHGEPRQVELEAGISESVAREKAAALSAAIWGGR